MKLGFWNRLAVVSAVLFTFVCATWMVLSTNKDSSDRKAEAYSDCIKMVSQPYSDLTVEYCSEVWLQPSNFYGWNEWFQFLGMFALMAAILYAVIWLAVWIVKWILRGRNIAH
jgi:hypothetical protein